MRVFDCNFVVNDLISVQILMSQRLICLYGFEGFEKEFLLHPLSS